MALFAAPSLPLIFRPLPSVCEAAASDAEAVRAARVRAVQRCAYAFAAVCGGASLICCAFCQEAIDTGMR